jgi:hypothetical protein
VTWREVSGLVALLLLLGVLFTWPLARHIGTDVLYTHEAAPGYERVPIAQGDHLQLLYVFWLLGDSLREGRSLLTDPYQFQTGGPSGFLFQPSLLPLLTLLLSPLGLVRAYNVLTLLSFAAAGLSAYLLVRLETSDRWAAVAGALVVALFPFRVTQLAGHANGFLLFLVPLYLYCFERSLRGARWVGWAVAAGAAFFFSGAMEFHIVYYLTLFLCAYLPFRFLFPLTDWSRPREGRAVNGRDLLPNLLAAAGGAGFGIAVYHSMHRMFRFHHPAGWIVTALGFALAAWSLWRGLLRLAAIFDAPEPESVPRALSRVLAPFSLLALAPLGSRLAISNFGRALAVIALVPAAWAVLRALRGFGGVRLRQDARRLLFARGRRYVLHVLLIACTLAFLMIVKKTVFAPSVAGGGRSFPEVAAFSPGPAGLLSPTSTNAEKMVYLGIVALLLAAAGAVCARKIVDPRRRLLVAFFGGTFALGTLLAVGPHLTVFPLYHLLYTTVPMFNFPRVTGRLLTVAAVGFAALAAAGLAGLRAWGGRWAGVLTIACLLPLVADYLPRHRPGLTTLPASHPVYDALAREKTPGEVILELPIWPGSSAWSSLYLWYTTRYRNRLLNGYSPAAPHDYVENIFRPLYPLDFGELRRPQYELLSRLGIRFIVFHEEDYPPKIGAYPFPFAAANLAESPYLEAVAAEPPLRLFRLRQAPPAAEAAFVRVSPVGSLYEAEEATVPPGVRSADNLASGGAVAASPSGKPRPLGRAFPNRVYPTGSYRVRARFLAEGPGPRPTLTLVVREPESGKVLGSAAGSPGDNGGTFDLVAPVAFSKPTGIAAEVFTDGAGPVLWDFLDVTFSADPEPRLAFEIEDLWHMGRPVARSEASSGLAVQLIPGYHPRDFTFSGPDRVLPAGAWIATLRYRTAPASAAAGEFFEVSRSNVTEPLARVPLPAAPDGTAWQSIDLPFALPRSAPIQFRVPFTGVRELLLDSIAIAPAGQGRDVPLGAPPGTARGSGQERGF